MTGILHYSANLQQEFNYLLKEMCNFVPENTIVMDFLVAESIGYGSIIETYYRNKSNEKELRLSLYFLAALHYIKSRNCPTKNEMYRHLNLFNTYNKLNKEGL